MLAEGKISERTYRRILDGNKRKTISSLFDGNRSGYRNRYLEELTGNQKEQAFTNYVTAEYLALTMEDGSTLHAVRSGAHGHDRESLQAAYERRGPVQVEGKQGRYFDSEPSAYVVDKATIDTDNGVKEIVFPHSLRPGSGSVALQPVLNWRLTKLPNGSMQRELITDTGFNGEDDSQPVDQPRVQLSRLAGLLALAYLSPDAREGWPAEVGLKDGHFKQKMGAAQIPVLALMKRNTLLKSPVIAAMEGLPAA
jgi:hypothetical protein